MVNEVPTGPDMGDIEDITCDKQTLPELMRRMAMNTFCKFCTKYFIIIKFCSLLLPWIKDYRYFGFPKLVERSKLQGKFCKKTTTKPLQKV